MIKVCRACGNPLTGRKILDWSRYRKKITAWQRCSVCNGLSLLEDDSQDFNISTADKVDNNLTQRQIEQMEVLDNKRYSSIKKDLQKAIQCLNMHPFMLDVGCGTGIALKTYRDIGGDGMGVEPAIPEAQYAQRVHNVSIPWRFIHEVDKTFHFILLCDVLEHVPNNRKFLSECMRCLSNDGYMLIRVPNARYFRIKSLFSQWAVRKQRTLLDSAIHVCYFTPRGGRLLCDEMGLVCEKMWASYSSSTHSKISNVIQRFLCFCSSVFGIVGFSIDICCLVRKKSIS